MEILNKGKEEIKIKKRKVNIKFERMGEDGEEDWWRDGKDFRKKRLIEDGKVERIDMEEKRKV